MRTGQPVKSWGRAVQRMSMFGMAKLEAGMDKDGANASVEGSVMGS